MKSILGFFLICVTLAVVCTGCVRSNSRIAMIDPSADPPVASIVVVSEDGNSAAAVIMCKYDNAISNTDMEKLRADVRNKLPNQTLKPGQPQVVAVFPAGTSTGTGRLVVYGYAINPEGIPQEYMGNAGNAQSLSYPYQGGEDGLFDHMKNSGSYVVTR